METELFAGRCVLTNCNVWSPDSQWVAFDTRTDPAGSTFDGTQIRMVNVETREVLMFRYEGLMAHRA